MELKKYEEDLVGGKYGSTVKKLMETMLKIGEINGAERLVEVESVHLASTSIYLVSGDLGMDLMGSLGESGIKFKALTLMDPVSVDIEDWERIGITEEFASKQFIATRALEGLGVLPVYTCTPYLIGYPPKKGDHLAWVETSSVIFANSYYGARTNREVDVSALASAICGRVPEYGFHRAENRFGNILVKVNAELHSLSDYGALGYYIGKRVGAGIPILTGIPKGVGVDALKNLGASMATSGQVTLFHIEGITPEANTVQEASGGNVPRDEMVVRQEEIHEAYQMLTTSTTDKINLVALGCPHCSLDELRDIAQLLEGKKVHENVAVLIFTSRYNKQMAARSGFVKIIEAAGAKVVADTCAVLNPITYSCNKVMATDSAKTAYYVPGCGLQSADMETKIIFGKRRQCIDAALSGRWRD